MSRDGLVRSLLLMLVLLADAIAAEPEPKPKLHILPGGSAAMRDASVGAIPTTPVAASGGGYEQGEILLLHPDLAAARSADASLRAVGGQLIRRREYPRLRFVVSTYRVPAATPLPSKVQQLLESQPDLLADLNHHYRLFSDRGDPKSQSFSAHLIEWPAAAGCGEGRRVGLLDSAVDTSPPALRHARIHQTSLLSAGIDAARPDHGTAIAGLLVGDPDVARFAGLIPRADLFVASVFRRDGDGEDTTVEWVVAGLDWLAQQQVSVINLSFGGPSNRILAAALERLQGLNIRIVAAAGNGGPDAPAPYPAAWDPAIAVTAVDADREIYPDANRGDYIDFAAPGVDVWTLGGEHGHFVSGTSFAAPFVTAAIAMGVTEEQLAASAIDLGASGADPVFGRGLIQMSPLRCEAAGG